MIHGGGQLWGLSRLPGDSIIILQYGFAQLSVYGPDGEFLRRFVPEASQRGGACSDLPGGLGGAFAGSVRRNLPDREWMSRKLYRVFPIGNKRPDGLRAGPTVEAPQLRA